MARQKKTSMPPALQEVPLGDLGLSDKELRFIASLCTSGYADPGKSYIEAGFLSAKGRTPSPSAARAQARVLMGRPAIRQALQRFADTVLDPYRERLEYQIIEYYTARAFWDPRDIFNDDGTVKPLNLLPERVLQVIDGVKEDYKGKDASVRMVTYELADRDAAVKQLHEWVKTGKAAKGAGSDTAEKVRRLIDTGKRRVMEAQRAVRNPAGDMKVTLEKMTIEESADGEKELTSH